MPEYQHPEASEPEVKEVKRETSSSSRSLLPGAILVTAVLISASIFYNTSLLLKKLDGRLGGSGNSNVLSQQVLSQQLQQQPTEQNNTGPVNVLSRSDAPVLGKSDAKVTIVEFSDFQCPFCARFFKESFGQIKSKYIDTGKAKLVLRHYPLPMHVNAQKAAEAAECANRQGKFWEYQGKLFTNGQSDGTGLATPDLKKYADELGLNKGTLGFSKNKFNQCLDSGEAAEAVKQDLAEAGTAGINSTPTFVINGSKVVGAQPFSEFEKAIEQALK